MVEITSWILVERALSSTSPRSGWTMIIVSYILIVLFLLTVIEPRSYPEQGDPAVRPSLPRPERKITTDFQLLFWKLELLPRFILIIKVFQVIYFINLTWKRQFFARSRKASGDAEA